MLPRTPALPASIGGVLAATLMAILLVFPTGSHAQTPLDDGTRLMQQGRYQDALGHLLPAWANDASARLAYAIARCYDGLNEDALAIKFYKSALSMRPRIDRGARKHAKSRVKVLKKRPQTRTEKATLYLEANASGGLVLLDGQEIGRTPLSGVLVRPGQHRISVIHDSFERWDKSFVAAPRESVRLVAEMVDKPTDVLIHSEPAGAVARLSDGTECITPCLMALRAGDYELSLQRQGYAVLFHKFKKAPGQMVEVRLTLKTGSAATPPTGQTGIMALAADQVGAQVYVDGTIMGTTPLPGPLRLSPGEHVVQIQLTGYYPWTGRVQITAGRTTPVSVRMRQVGTASPGTATPVGTTNVVSAGDAGKAPWQKPTGWALLGTGIGLAVGGALAVALPTVLNQREIDLAVRFKIDNTQYISGITRTRALELEEQAKLWSGVGYGLMGTGAALIIAGGVILGIDAGDAAPDPFAAPGVSVVPMVGPNQVGAAATLSF